MHQKDTTVKINLFFIIPSMVGGGAEKVTSIILNRLDRNRFNLTLVVFSKKGEYIDQISGNVKIIDLNKTSKWDFLKLIFKLREVIKYKKPDVIFSLLDYANIITVLATLFLKNRPNIIISERNYHRMYLKNSRMRAIVTFLLKFTYRRASKIIAVSNAIRTAMIEDLGIDASKTIVIYNPVETENIRSLSNQEISHHYFKDDDKTPVIFSVGRLTKEKKFDLLIRAFSILRRKTAAYLIIAGQGDLKDELTAFAKKMGVEKYVDFIGFQKNPFAWMRKAKIFALSSENEGFPNVILEAMACGLPVISTDCISGPSEIIGNGKNGFLVPVNDPAALAESMSILLNNESMRNGFSREGLKRVEDFNVSRIIPQYERLFKIAA